MHARCPAPLALFHIGSKGRNQLGSPAELSCDFVGQDFDVALFRSAVDESWQKMFVVQAVQFAHFGREVREDLINLVGDIDPFRWERGDGNCMRVAGDQMGGVRVVIGGSIVVIRIVAGVGVFP